MATGFDREIGIGIRNGIPRENLGRGTMETDMLVEVIRMGVGGANSHSSPRSRSHRGRLYGILRVREVVAVVRAVVRAEKGGGRMAGRDDTSILEMPRA